MSVFRAAALFFVLAAVSLSPATHAAAPGGILNQRLAAWSLCAAAAANAESRQRIPRGLLHAISLVESGRLHQRRKRAIAWPWTVRAEGKGYFHPSKRAAVSAVAALQRRGVANIDVGCMQVNLMHHPKAFPSLDAAFDPAHNVAYAAGFLTDLKQRHKSWRVAVQHYHSAEPDRRIPYQKKVYVAWRNGASEEHRPPLRQKRGMSHSP